MKQTFEKVEPGIYRREYVTANGPSVLYYGRLKVKRTGNRELFALGPNLKEARDQFSIIKVKNRRGEDLGEFKAKPKAQQIPEAGPMTVERWSEIYLAKDEVVKLHSHSRDQDFGKHVNRFFGKLLLTQVKREHLFQYRDQRLKEFIIRNNKPSQKRVSRGEVTNELAFLRKMLKAAAVDEISVSIPSFSDKSSKKTERLMWRHPGRDRILEPEEESKLIEFYPPWLVRMATFAQETALNQGDTMELKRSMIDRKRRLVMLPDGRNKTGQQQTPFLSDVALKILDEIEADKRSGKIVASIEGYVFTRDDGAKLNKDMVTGAVKRARNKAGVGDFRYHDYRHMAQTAWAVKNVPGPIARKMAGLSSAQMLQRYQNIKPRHVTEFMSKLENVASRMVDTDGRHEVTQDNKERANS
jgi:integrase